MTTPKSLALWTKTNTLRPVTFSAWMGGHGIASKATNPLWRLLHAMADAAVPAMIEDVAAALASVGVSLDQPALLALLADGQRGAVERAVRAAWNKVGQRGLQEALALKLEALALAAASRTPIATVSVRFNVQDLESLSVIRAYAGGQIVGISATTREAIQGILERAFTSGTPLAQQIDEIAQLVGLTDQQAASLAKLRGELLAAGETPAAVQTQVAQRSAVMRRQRAEIISRTESLGAVNMGQHERTAQAIRDGLLDAARVKRFWIVTADEQTCPICSAIPGMNPEGVGPKQAFNTPVGALMHPTAHPACRCAVSITIID